MEANFFMRKYLYPLAQKVDPWGPLFITTTRGFILTKNRNSNFMPVLVTSDAGLLAYRVMDDVFGLTDMVACELREWFCVNFQQRYLEN